MPISLQEVSRRRFLAHGALAAAGTWCFGSRALGADDAPAGEPAIERWALLSDTHVAEKPDARNLGVNMSDNLRRCIGEVLAAQNRPLGVLIDGDCAYLEGLPGDYTQLIDVLNPLRDAGLPIHMSLGNHDQRDNFHQAFAERQEAATAFDARHVAVVEGRLANWFIVDSLDKTNSTPGRLGNEQLEWLSRALDAHADKPAIVFGHHHPVISDDTVPGLNDTEELFAIIEPRRHVKAYVFGHTHHWSKREHAGIHLVNLPPTAYVFAKPDPNGWVNVELSAGGAVFTLQALDAGHRLAGQRFELAWRSESGGDRD